MYSLFEHETNPGNSQDMYSCLRSPPETSEWMSLRGRSKQETERYTPIGYQQMLLCDTIIYYDDATVNASLKGSVKISKGGTITVTLNESTN